MKKYVFWNIKDFFLQGFAQLCGLEQALWGFFCVYFGTSVAQ